MRVISVIGGTGKAKVSAGQALPNPSSGLRNLMPAGVSADAQVVLATDDQFMSVPAAGPQVLDFFSDRAPQQLAADDAALANATVKPNRALDSIGAAAPIMAGNSNSTSY
jgi:hypothetical protein